MAIKWIVRNLGIGVTKEIVASNFDDACRKLGWQKKLSTLVKKEYTNGK